MEAHQEARAMKPTHEELARGLAVLTKERDLLRLGLIQFLEKPAGILTPDLAESISKSEVFNFYLMDLDKPHGGIVLIVQKVGQADSSILTHVRVDYLDEIRRERERQSTRSTWWATLGRLIEKADRIIYRQKVFSV